MSSIPSSESVRGIPNEGMFTEDLATSAAPITPFFIETSDVNVDVGAKIADLANPQLIQVCKT